MRYFILEVWRRLKAVVWSELFAAIKQAGRAFFELGIIVWLMKELFEEVVRALLDMSVPTHLSMSTVVLVAFIIAVRRFHARSLLEHARAVYGELVKAVADIITAFKGRD